MIKEFKNEYNFLSNFYPCDLNYMGFDWKSSENAYQASKFPLSHYPIIRDLTPAEAKKYARNHIDEMLEGWEKDRIRNMRAIVFAKFSQNPHLAKLLLDTGRQEIQEGNWWNDRFFGISPVGSGLGKNYLGIIIMDVRTTLRDLEEENT